MVELIVVIAILVVFAAVLIPSLLQYTENSRAQKDVSTMDEVVNAVQLAVADEQCFDEALKYSCTNNYLTYSDSSGVYGQQVVDGEFWAPDGSGRATTITFNPEYGPNNQIIYDLSKGIVNDMTYGNGSSGQSRVMEGALIENNQCYLNKMPCLYNAVRQSIGNDVITTSQTYRNSSFTVFIKFTQKDGITVADINGSFNGTNLYEGVVASKGSGTNEYDNNGDAITTVKTPGTTESNYTSSDLSGTGSFTPDYKMDALPSVPVGGSYISSNGTTFSEGDKITDDIMNGDIYQDSFYEYKYNYLWNGSKWIEKNGQNGWGVRVLDKNKTEYGQMESVINGKDVTTLDYTFYDCRKLKNPPVLSSKATSMRNTFRYCNVLVAAPTIPETMIDMSYAFYSCGALENDGMPILPSGVKNLNSTFSSCYKLYDLSEFIIPSSVENLNSAFASCNKLEKAPILPEGVISIDNTFNWCVKLTTAPKIPSTVTSMYRTFYYCPALCDVSDMVIPKGVTSLKETFYHTGLTDDGLPILPDWITDLYYTFGKCESLVNLSTYTIPSSTTKMNRTFMGCTALKYAPTIPQNVQTMQYTFTDCQALTGTITINAKSLTGYLCDSAFKDVDFATQNITLTGSSTFLDALGASGKNYCATCNGKCNGSH